MTELIERQKVGSCFVCPRDPNTGCSGAPRYEIEREDCCRITPPPPCGFSVGYRNPGHWDICTSQRGGRAFRIRGEPDNVLVLDEREMDSLPPHPREPRRFRSVGAAMAWCAEELMHEPGVPQS